MKEFVTSVSAPEVAIIPPPAGRVAWVMMRADLALQGVY
jgi:hypothetical protein